MNWQDTSGYTSTKNQTKENIMDKKKKQRINNEQKFHHKQKSTMLYLDPTK